MRVHLRAGVGAAGAGLLLAAIALLPAGCRDRLREPLHTLAPPADLPTRVDVEPVPDELPVAEAVGAETADLLRLHDPAVDVAESELVALAASPDLRIRRAVAQRLARSGAGTTDGVAALRELVGDPTAVVRHYAFTALGRSGALGRVVLLELAEDAGPEDLISLIAAATADSDPSVTALLASLVGHPTEAVAELAVRGLFGRTDTPVPALSAALLDPRHPVSCAAALVLAYSPRPTSELPPAPAAVGCLAVLAARHGDLAVLECAAPELFGGADELQRRACVETVLASPTERAAGVVFEWLATGLSGIDAGSFDELAPYAQVPMVDPALQRLRLDPADATALLALARFADPGYSPTVRELQQAAQRLDPVLGERYGAVIDAIERRNEAQ